VTNSRIRYILAPRGVPDGKKSDEWSAVLVPAAESRVAFARHFVKLLPAVVYPDAVRRGTPTKIQIDWPSDWSLAAKPFDATTNRRRWRIAISK